MPRPERSRKEDETIASELIETDLYNERFHVVHNPNARGSQPRYVVNDTTKPQGVTTILGGTLSKDLMQWAVDCMGQYLMEKLEDGITSDHIEEASEEYIRRRDSGAGTGTEAHAMVEHFLKGMPVDLSSASPEARNAYNAFVKWFKSVKPEVINVEAVIYSETFEYAGTYDCMLRIDGKTYLCDLKTTNASRKAPRGVYPEYFLQLGAYAGAHNEQRDYENSKGQSSLPVIDDLMVISARKDGKLDIITASDVGLTVDGCNVGFLNVVQVSRFLRGTAKKLGGN